MEFSFEDADVRRYLGKILERSKQVKGAADRYVALISVKIFQDVMQHFDDEIGSSGSWPDWSDSYKEQLKKIGRGGNRMLQFSGRMRQNFTPQKYRKNAQGILWYNNAKADGFPYAWAHNEGGGRLPQREFMWASDKAVDQIAVQTLDFIVEENV